MTGRETLDWEEGEKKNSREKGYRRVSQTRGLVLLGVNSLIVCWLYHDARVDRQLTTNLSTSTVEEAALRILKDNILLYCTSRSYIQLRA